MMRSESSGSIDVKIYCRNPRRNISPKIYQLSIISLSCSSSHYSFCFNFRKFNLRHELTMPSAIMKTANIIISWERSNHFAIMTI